ncbi:TlyA family RNA methyltransferase [Enterococcus timonensis]|uniref:TlyA family RNA methyltransferase n=1 Tax=Enterococcus timonensis TaxID=1852364 RepID=UPI0008D9C268|nr:TlyA family RNA methyltransferase [Enterococcus timonensis]
MKERIDVLAVQQGLFETREKAKRGIMAGLLYNENNQRFDKPGEKIPAETKLHIKGEKFPYVSRGGLKLKKALASFGLDVTDKIILDIGSSTGGFTDVALRSGAAMSYALDVGYNQLAWSLRQDPRVEVMERVNFRYSKPEDFTKGLPDVATIDVSFISLRLIFPPLKNILVHNGEVVALVKPQFEAGKEQVGKHGVIKDPKVHQMVLEKAFSYALDAGFTIAGLDFSPITGGVGNIEFLLYLKNNEDVQQLVSKEEIKEVVTKAHQTLRQD